MENEVIKPWGWHRVEIETSDGQYQSGAYGEIPKLEYGEDDHSDSLGRTIGDLVEKSGFANEAKVLQGMASTLLDIGLDADDQFVELARKLAEYKPPEE